MDITWPRRDTNFIFGCSSLFIFAVYQRYLEWVLWINTVYCTIFWAVCSLLPCKQLVSPILRSPREKPQRATVWISIEHVWNASHPTWCIWHHFLLFHGKSVHSRLTQTQQLHVRSWTHLQVPKQVYQIVLLVQI